MPRSISWSNAFSTDRVFSGSVASMDVDQHAQSGVHPDLRSSDRLERRFWSDRLVPIKPSGRGHVANHGNRVRNLDPSDGYGPRLLFDVRAGHKTFF